MVSSYVKKRPWSLLPSSLLMSLEVEKAEKDFRGDLAVKL